MFNKIDKLKLKFHENRIAIILISTVFLSFGIALLELNDSVFLVKLIASILLILSLWGFLGCSLAINESSYEVNKTVFKGSMAYWVLLIVNVGILILFFAIAFCILFIFLSPEVFNSP